MQTYESRLASLLRRGNFYNGLSKTSCNNNVSILKYPQSWLEQLDLLEICEKAMILLKPSAILKAVIKAPARAGDVNSSFKFQLVKLGLKLFYATEN